MNSNNDNIRELTLLPGQLHFGTQPMRLQTLLGSCVSIVLWHPHKKLAGMSHYLLGHRGKNRRQPQGYYAEDVVALFLMQIRNSATEVGDYRVKLFGGSNMFAPLASSSNAINVARDNIQQGLALLSHYGFKVDVTDVGGYRYRKLYLETWNGDVWVQYGPDHPSWHEHHGKQPVPPLYAKETKPCWLH